MRVPDLKKCVYPEAAVRNCINCKQPMQSMSRGHRMCPRCKIERKKIGIYAFRTPYSLESIFDRKQARPVEGYEEYYGD